MKRAARRWAPIAGTCMALLASGAQAQTTANGPYYATPSWDQTIPVASRYVVLANFNSDAVLDRETGLVWQRTRSPAYYQWIPAFRYCMNLRLGNRRGWRLPTAAEMLSLFDATTLQAPGLPPGNPFIGISPTGDGFWTTTQDRTSAFQYYHEIAYLAGTFEPLANRLFVDDQSHVLCVRSAAPLGSLPF